MMNEIIVKEYQQRQKDYGVRFWVFVVTSTGAAVISMSTILNFWGLATILMLMALYCEIRRQNSAARLRGFYVASNSDERENENDNGA